MQTQTSLVLDGSHGEGGGQILRTSLFLSVLTGRPFRMNQIRQNRPQPGLKPQHEGIIRLLCEMTRSQADGVRAGSESVEFAPGRLRAGAYTYDIGTAGSIPLFLQTVLPLMLATPGRTELVLVGGTDVTFGPTIEWVRRAYAPFVAPLASELQINVDRRGFYPKGGGRVRVVVQNALQESDLSAFRTLVRRALGGDRLQWQEPVTLELVSVAHARLQARRVAERQSSAAQQRLAEGGLVAQEQVLYADTLSPGSSLTLVGTDRAGNRIATDGLGAQGVLAETVGQSVADAWLREASTGAVVDEHLADHVVPWVALGAGGVRIPRVTGHLSTNVWTCEQFLGEGCVAVSDGVLHGLSPKKQSG